GVERVEAHRKNVKLVSYAELDFLQAVEQAILSHGAKHGTTEINQGEDHRLLAEVIAQPHRLASFIPKLQVKRNLFIQPLVDPYSLQERGKNFRIVGAGARC